MAKEKNEAKEAAKLEVQRLLAQAEGLLEAAGKIMDEHQFSTTFQDRVYFPRGLKLVSYDEGEEVEDDDDGYQYVRPDSEEGSVSWMYFYKADYGYLAGKWKSSSEYSNC